MWDLPVHDGASAAFTWYNVNHSLTGCTVMFKRDTLNTDRSLWLRNTLVAFYWCAFIMGQFYMGLLRFISNSWTRERGKRGKISLYVSSCPNKDAKGWAFNFSFHTSLTLKKKKKSYTCFTMETSVKLMGIHLERYILNKWLRAKTAKMTYKGWSRTQGVEKGTRRRDLGQLWLKLWYYEWGKWSVIFDEMALSSLACPICIFLKIKINISF